MQKIFTSAINSIYTSSFRSNFREIIRSEFGVATVHSNDAFCVGLKVFITIQSTEMEMFIACSESVIQMHSGNSKLASYNLPKDGPKVRCINTVYCTSTYFLHDDILICNLRSVT